MVTTKREVCESIALMIVTIVCGVLFLWAMCALHQWSDGIMAHRKACNPDAPIVACSTRDECVRVNCL